MRTVMAVRVAVFGLLAVSVVAGAQEARADFATSFVEINNKVGDISEAHGFVVALGPGATSHFLVIVTTDTMEFVVIRATADKDVVKDSLLGRWVIIKAQVVDRKEDPNEKDASKRVTIQLKILSVRPPEKEKGR